MSEKMKYGMSIMARMICQQVKGKDYIDGFLFAVGRPKAIFPGKLRLVYA